MPYQHRRKKAPKSARPDNAILAKRKRDRKKAEHNANPLVIERRLQAIAEHERLVRSAGYKRRQRAARKAGRA